MARVSPLPMDALIPETATIEVDVIIPVHNAHATLEATLQSALAQVALPPDTTDRPATTDTRHQPLPRVKVFVCCYDDGSDDASWHILTRMFVKHNNNNNNKNNTEEGRDVYFPTTMVLGRSADGVSRGAGYARNRAVALRPTVPSCSSERYLCLLDSDDRMQPTRIVEQLTYLRGLPAQARHCTLLGCRVVRDPPDATWHYTQWANSLSNERLRLEQFREVTLLQPTWMMARAWFVALGGYLEAPSSSSSVPFCLEDYIQAQNEPHKATTTTPPRLFQLIHPTYDTAETLRLAEDTRFFYKHIDAGGALSLLPTIEPLLIYRHREGQSQSAQTPRRLLLHLRLAAFSHLVLQKSPHWSKKGQQFCIWGAGRDGKDFIKALPPEVRARIACIVDVDPKKINIGYYYHKVLGFRIPVVHFSLLARDPAIRARLGAAFEEGRDVHEPGYGRIHKGRDAARQQGALVGTARETETTTANAMAIGRDMEGTPVETEIATPVATPHKTSDTTGETPLETPDKPPLETPVETTTTDATSTTTTTTVATDVGVARPTKRRKLVSRVQELNKAMLPSLPVVVCVSMYRTGGALEHNVQQIGRTEGVDLWHFS
jgi:glycosyltransferase involved in cell wall biosynthesis